MSIINDALKKAQASLKKKEDKEEKNIKEGYDKLSQKKSAPSHPSRQQSIVKDKEEASSQPKPWYKNIVVISCTLAIVAGCLVAVLLNKGDKFHFKFGIQKDVVKKRVYRPGELILNGTIVSGNKKSALINDKIYEIGDEVQGHKLMNITIDSVELLDNTTGETRTIKNK